MSPGAYLGSVHELLRTHAKVSHLITHKTISITTYVASIKKILYKFHVKQLLLLKSALAKH